MEEGTWVLGRWFGFLVFVWVFLLFFCLFDFLFFGFFESEAVKTNLV